MERIIMEENTDHLNVDVQSILEKAEMRQAQAASTICADMRKMINDPEYSDIVFPCKDGARIHASRLFLVARSIVFHRMLLNGMAESKLPKITLHDVSSTALLPVMEFLYTGTLQEHGPKDWKNAYKIIGAARFFLLEGLELTVMDYLRLATAKMGVDTETAAEFLSITLEFVDILGETVELIARDLVRILKSTSLKPQHLHALTFKAFMFFLKKTKDDSAQPTFLSHAEFWRLKNIIMWCACEKFVPKESLMLHAIPPEIKSTLEVLEKPPVPQDIMACQQSEIYRRIRVELALSVNSFLPLVNLRRIPPRYFVHVVEPMDILPSFAIMDTLRFHALQTSHEAEGKPGWSTSFKSHEMYRVSKDGLGIKQTVPGIGFARYNVTIDRGNGDDGYYGWQLIIEKVCDGFIEIGLHQDLGSNSNLEVGQSLSGQPGGWALRMDSTGLSINRKGIHQADQGDPSFVPYGKDCSQLVYGKDYAHKGSSILVYVNMIDMTCHFKVDKHDRRLAWSDIPDGTFSPAISLGTGSGGRVKFKDLSL